MDGLLDKYKTASGEAQSEGSEANQPQVNTFFSLSILPPTFFSLSLYYALYREFGIYAFGLFYFY